MKHLQLFEDYKKFEPLFKKKVREHFPEDYSKIFRIIDNFNGRNNVKGDISKTTKPNKWDFLDDDKKVEDIMQEISDLIGGHGVEPISDEQIYVSKFWFNTVAIYVNMGDTYATTILYDTQTNKFDCTTYGDFVEEMEREKEKDGDDFTYGEDHRIHD